MKKIYYKTITDSEILCHFPHRMEHILTDMSCEIVKGMLDNDCFEIEENTNKYNGIEISMSIFTMKPTEFQKVIDILRKLQSLNSTHVNELIEIFKY